VTGVQTWALPSWGGHPAAPPRAGSGSAGAVVAVAAGPPVRAGADSGSDSGLDSGLDAAAEAVAGGPDVPPGASGDDRGVCAVVPPVASGGGTRGMPEGSSHIAIPVATTSAAAAR